MKSNLTLFIVLGAGVALGGCVSPRTISVPAADASRVVDGRGNPVPPSRQQVDVKVILVTSKFSNDTDALPTFYLEVRNRGASGVDFSPENVVAFSGGSRVRVYTSSELADRIKREAEAEAAAAAANEASQLKGASMSRQATSRNMMENPVPWAVTKAQNDARSGMNQIEPAGEQQPADLGQLLQTSSIPPHGTVGGAVVFHAEDIRSGQPLRLLVTVGGEVHEFRFEVGD